MYCYLLQKHFFLLERQRIRVIHWNDTASPEQKRHVDLERQIYFLITGMRDSKREGEGQKDRKREEIYKPYADSGSTI